MDPTVLTVAICATGLALILAIVLLVPLIWRAFHDWMRDEIINPAVQEAIEAERYNPHRDLDDEYIALVTEEHRND